VQDISYLVICAVLTFFFVLVFSDGKIRGYIFWGELLGFLVYYFSVGMVTAQLFRAIIKVVRRSLRAVAHLFLTPGRWFSRKIAGFSEKMYNLYKNESKKFQSKAKYTLQQRNFLLYNLRGEQKEKKRE
jgi:cell shape-determining protein MreC